MVPWAVVHFVIAGLFRRTEGELRGAGRIVGVVGGLIVLGDGVLHGFEHNVADCMERKRLLLSWLVRIHLYNLTLFQLFLAELLDPHHFTSFIEQHLLLLLVVLPTLMNFVVRGVHLAAIALESPIVCRACRSTQII